jgi:hypothetical protein
MREEFDASQKMKHNARIIVVLGNPPYDAFAGVAQSEEAELVAHYKGVELVDDIDNKTKQVKRDEFGKPKKKQRGQSLLYIEYGVRKQLLDDLYIRFLRLAEERIGEAAEYGVVSYISNSSYLTGRSHPLMRKSLLSKFNKVWIDNLNGDKYRTGKLIPAGLSGAGSADQSAFTTEMDPRGIQPGTAIATWVKYKGAKTAPTETKVYYRDFWGLAASKRMQLLASLPTGERAPDSAVPRYLEIKPALENRWRLSPTQTEGGFESWPSLEELFPTNYQGVQPSRGLEGSVMDTSRADLAARLRSYFSADSFAAAKEKAPEISMPRARYNPERAWVTLKRLGHYKDNAIIPFLVFPFDQRFLYYSPEEKWLNEARREFVENKVDNEFLACVFEPRKLSEVYPLYSSEVVNYHLHERGSYVFPRDTLEAFSPERYANLAEPVWRAISAHNGVVGTRATPEARAYVGRLFRVAFAVLYAPAYQHEHKSALSADWAHLPIPKDRDLFERLVEKGEQITRLLDATRDGNDVIEAILGQERAKTLGPLRRVDKGQVRPGDLKITVSYWGGSRGRWKSRVHTSEEDPLDARGERTGDLYINDEAFFANVPEAVWTFQLGGYPVLKKWLAYRQADRREDRPLTDDERQWFRQAIQRIAALLALGSDLDALYQDAAVSAFTATELGIVR